MTENKFYRSNLHGWLRMVPLVILVLLAFFIMRNYYDPIDNFYFLMIALICSPLVILFMVYFVSGLVSVKNAKISYIELSENFISINNINGFLKIKQEYIEIAYSDIENIKVFFDYPFRCYNINIYKKGCKQRKDIATFELKISDYSAFIEVLIMHGVSVSRCSLLDFKNKNMENYRIYSRKPRWFIRILLIIITIFTLVLPIFALFGIILLLILSKDFRKSKSYIEFASSDVIIDDYQGGFLGTKHIRLEIPYDTIEKCKCFSYGGGRTQSGPCFNFNIYLKDGFDISIFSVGKLSGYNRNIAMFSVEEPNCHNIDEEYINQLFESKNIKIYMPKKGLFNF